MPRTVRRLLVVAGTVTATVGLTALPALAHVTVNSPSAVQGGYSTVNFKVPTESDTASTTGLKVQLPAETPFTSVSVLPKAGWTYTKTTAKLSTPIKGEGGDITDYVSTIEWKAAAGSPGIKPGEFDQFTISAGPMPKVAAIAFKAIQTYSDGKVVSWIEEPAAAGGAEPDYPAPTLKLAAAPAAGGSGVTATSAPAAAPAATDSDTASKGSVTGAYVLGGLGLLAGLAGLVLGLSARNRRSTVGEPKRDAVSTGAQ